MITAVTPRTDHISRSVPPSRAITREYVWASTLIACGLPKIVCQEFGFRLGIWLSLGELVVLLALALVAARRQAVQNVVGFILAVTALKLGWDVVVPWIETSAFFRSLTSSLDWSIRFFLARAIRVFGALFMMITLIKSGLSRRDLFLTVGNLDAPVQAAPFFSFRRPVSWARFSAGLLVVFAVVLPLFMYFSLHPEIGRAHRLLPLLPLALATAALNAANEEFQFRGVLLARLKNLVSPQEAALITAVLFGVAHFFGQPSGWGGALMAGTAGWIWARSMIETRGFTCAFAIHFVLDVVIFGLLALTV